MFRSFVRAFLPNPLDWTLKRAAKKGAKTVLICWNRGLGDIALGVAAIVHRVRSLIPEASITVLTRDNLKDGFSMLDGIEIIADPTWKRGAPIDWKRSMKNRSFDVVLEKPSPTDWCRWQRKTFTPRLRWNRANDHRVEAFDLPTEFTYIGVQVEAETNYGLWRNWPMKRWQELFDLLEKRGDVRVLLFGYGDKPVFSHPMMIDLRGKTGLFDLLSIIKNRCYALILPDSGILSMTYYLDASFPIRLVSLWADPDHGVLKQGVASPNPALIHTPLIGNHRDLSSVSALQVMEALFPKKRYAPLRFCTKQDEVKAKPADRVGCVILGGGQGSRLGVPGPKGLFPVLDKTLFQHHLEKIPSSMPVAIMTSALNHRETVEYFEKNNFFDHTIWFFQQESMPLLDEKYRLVGSGPNGNGSLYASIFSSGVLECFEKAGVDTVLISPIENPLANPADEKLLTFHRDVGADVTIKCVEREKDEKMGALVEENGQIRIVEYFDVVEDDFSFSYMGQAALSTAFIRKAAHFKLPFHWVRKKAFISGSEVWVWKRECLFFNAFSGAQKVAALCYPRSLCYAPIKGPEHKLAVEQLLLKIREKI